MRVRLRSIAPVGGLDVNLKILPQVIGKVVAAKDEVPQIFDTPVEAQIHLELMGKDVYLTGEATTTIHPICARCGESFPSELKVDASLTCRPLTQRMPGTDSYQESEDGLIFFRNEELDLDEILREQMLLALPMKYLCRADCLGLCPKCGANLNLGPHACTVKAAKKS